MKFGLSGMMNSPIMAFLKRVQRYMLGLPTYLHTSKRTIPANTLLLFLVAT